MRVTVGVSGAGSLIGQGIIKALKLSSLNARIVAFDFFPEAAGLYWADANHLLPDVLAPSVGEKEYVGELTRWLREEKVQVLLIGTDFEVTLLARHKEQIERESGCRLLVCPPPAARIADDKWETFKFLKSQGLPCPPSLADISKLNTFVEEVGFPLVVKPRHGSRARKVFFVHEWKELMNGLAEVGNAPIVQRLVGSPHTEYTCGALAFGDDCWGTICMRRDLRDGNTYRAYIEPHPGIDEIVKRTALALGPEGPANVQLRLAENGEPMIFEINARFSGTTIIRAMAGFNEVEAAVRWRVFGQPTKLVSQRSGVVLRHWEEMFLDWSVFESMGGKRKL